MCAREQPVFAAARESVSAPPSAGAESRAGRQAEQVWAVASVADLARQA